MGCFKFKSELCIAAAVAAAGLLMQSPSVADNDVWKTAANGTWSAGMSWVDGSPPATFDQATFNLPGAYTVSFSTDPSAIAELALTNAANVTFASSSRPPSPIVPRTLQLVKNFAGGGNLAVSGTLTLGSGGFPFHLTAQEDISVIGVTAALNVKFGSVVHAAQLGNSGKLSITGAGSSVIAANYGTFKGDLNVTQEGLLHSGGGIHAGALTVTGAGSRWTDTGILQLGFAGTLGPIPGVLSIADGALLESAVAVLGDETAAGTVTVAGDGSRWTSGGSLLIGRGGVGTINVQPGGTVVDGETVIGPRGLLRLQGGTFDSRDFRFDGSNDSQFEWTTGTLRLGTYHGNLTNSTGTLAPGRELGEAFIEGNLTSSAGATTEIQIGGTTPGVTFDRVRVANAITLLGGSLEVSLLNGFLPSATDAFQVMSSLSGVFTGSFANVASGQRLTTSDGLGSFLVSYGPGSPQVVLSGFQTVMSGDFDVDGDVDGADFLVWQRGQSPNPNSTGDLAAWRSNFGASSVAAGAAVPEPNAAWLAAAIVLYACLGGLTPGQDGRAI